MKSTFQKVQISKFRAFFIPRLALSKFVEESPLYRFPNFFFVLPPPLFFPIQDLHFLKISLFFLPRKTYSRTDLINSFILNCKITFQFNILASFLGIFEKRMAFSLWNSLHHKGGKGQLSAGTVGFSKFPRFILQAIGYSVLNKIFQVVNAYSLYGRDNDISEESIF